MALFLTPEETLLKSWDFATTTPETQQKTQAKDNTSVLNLSVTNKRIILQNESPVSLEKREILMKDVCGVSVSRRENPSRSNTTTIVLGIIFLVMGLILVCAPLLADMDMLVLVAVGLIIVIVGIVFICIRNKGTLAFSLCIHTRAISSNVISTSLKSTPVAGQQKESNIIVPLNIYIKKEDVVEIADIIGSLIVKNN